MKPLTLAASMLLALASLLPAQANLLRPISEATAWTAINDTPLPISTIELWTLLPPRDRGARQTFTVPKTGHYRLSCTSRSGTQRGEPGDLWLTFKLGSVEVKTKNGYGPDIIETVCKLDAGQHTLEVSALAWNFNYTQDLGYQYQLRPLSVSLVEVVLPAPTMTCLAEPDTQENEYALLGGVCSPETDLAIMLFSWSTTQGIKVYGINGLLLLDPAALFCFPAFVPSKTVWYWGAPLWWGVRRLPPQASRWLGWKTQILAIDFDAPSFTLGTAR